jgi:capsular exopolysaccharide synthesis family protein
MIRTGIDNLSLILSGPPPPNPSELLDSRRMKAILDEIKETVDLVILDSPPVLAVTDAAALGPKVDGVIVAVRSKRTSHETARRACLALDSVGAAVLGAVLVGIGRRGRMYYYYSTREGSARRLARKRFKWFAKFQSRRNLATRD